MATKSKNNNPAECPNMASNLKDAASCIFFTGESPLRLNVESVRDEAPLHLVVGDNGSGKSFLVQVLAAWAHKDKCTPLQVSMAYRTRAGMERAFMYGSDEDQSTGVNSIGVVKGAISSMRSWGAKPHVALFDEPDTGLSDRYAHPLGAYIAQFAIAPAEGTKGVLVISHSRTLIRGIVDELAKAGQAPSVAFLGTRYTSLDQYLADEDRGSIDEMLEVHDKAHATWRALHAVLQGPSKAPSKSIPTKASA